MRRRQLPPVDDVERTLRRSALLAISAGMLAATVSTQSAVGIASRTRGRLERALETVVAPLSTARSADSEPQRDEDSSSRTLPGPTTRDELAESGLVPRTYVHGVLREHGGRMRQRRFVDDYGWTPSTVSRLLTELEQNGEIDRYRLGREKVVCLPQDDRSTDGS